MPDFNLTPAEQEVMDVVWDRGPVSVQDVVDGLARPLAYTTVMTTLKILESKRKVLKRVKQGRAFVYSSVATREEVSRNLAGQLTKRLHHGSVKSFVLSLIDPRGMSSKDISELKKAIQSLERKR